MPNCGAKEPARNLSSIVDPKGTGGSRAGEIDRSEYSAAIQETVECCAVKELTHDLPFVVDPKGIGLTRTRNIDCGEDAPAIQETVRACAVNEVPYDLSAIVDATPDEGLTRAGNIDRCECA